MAQEEIISAFTLPPVLSPRNREREIKNAVVVRSSILSMKQSPKKLNTLLKVFKLVMKASLEMRTPEFQHVLYFNVKFSG